VTIETVRMTDRTPVPLLTKLNPLWWLVGPDGWNVPDVNNGEPYLPDVKNVWLRRFYWFVCRNPLMNFMGMVVGVEDNNYTVIGTAPVLLNTWRDAQPRRTGWKWSIILPQPSVTAMFAFIMFTSTTILVHPIMFVPAVFACLKIVGPLPFISYYNGTIEFYHGWRPSSGGFGTKLVKRADT
jgi:hypothetical protein